MFHFGFTGYPIFRNDCITYSFLRQPELINGAMIHGLESRVNLIEEKLSDIDARTSEEADNALNERELDRFIMSGKRFISNIDFGINPLK